MPTFADKFRQRLGVALCCTLLSPLLLACAPEQGSETDTASSVQPVRDEQPDYASLRARQERRLQALENDLSQSRDARATAPARSLFEGWLYHARLTGELASFDRAAEALSELETRQRTGPACREQAELALANHRITDAAAALAACPEADNRDLLIDIHYYQGNYRRAVTEVQIGLFERSKQQGSV